jgi:predicted GNAT superfamily acetyltransferase
MTAAAIRIRELEHHREMEALERVFAEIWGFSDRQVIPKVHFVGCALAGHQVHGAFEGDRLVGASWGFLCWDGAELVLHSHITGVLEAYRGTGLGHDLKTAQRAWCLQRGIRRVTWTFDPLVVRNAAFNLRKLGARGVRFLPNFYGAMEDRFNRGEPTDRIEVDWDLARQPRPLEAPRSWLLADRDGIPFPGEVGREPVGVAVPGDFARLRETDPTLASAWRNAIRAALESAFGGGLTATGFHGTWGGAYLFTREPA